MGMYVAIRAIKAEDVKSFLGDPNNLNRHRQSGPSISLEKAWHGLHYLLTGSATEGGLLGFIVEGGKAVGSDMGYGPPRFFEHADVAALNRALAAISDDDLWSRFDSARMEEEGVYPLIWDEPESNLREEYLHYFHELKNLVQQADKEKLGLLLMLT